MQNREDIRPFFSTNAAAKRHHKAVMQIAAEQFEAENSIKKNFGSRTQFSKSFDFLACSFVRAGGTAIRRKLKRERKKLKRKNRKPRELRGVFVGE